eukprot:3727898-Rhodomonas_salina.1
MDIDSREARMRIREGGEPHTRYLAITDHGSPALAYYSYQIANCTGVTVVVTCQTVPHLLLE